MARRLHHLACATLLVLIWGCGGGGPEFAEVEGTVKKDGKALKNVRVEFWPEANGPKSTGITDEQGRYALKSEDGKSVGAMVGSHKVVLKDLDLYGDKFLGRKAENMTTLNPGAKPRFAKTYADAIQTDLKKSVSAGPKNTIDIEVK